MLFLLFLYIFMLLDIEKYKKLGYIYFENIYYRR